MTSNQNLVPLRRTIRPYIGQIVILIAVTAFAVYESLASSDWEFLWAPAVYLPLYGIYFLYFGLKYRVFWSEESVVMRARGGPDQRVRFGEITSVKKEISSASDVLAQSRPFRRIVVCGNKDDPKARVDISLRHFNLNDIGQLLRVIHTHRRDLEIPTIQATKAASRRAG
jgi:hypothetical protein